MDPEISILISKEIEKFINEKSPKYAPLWSRECSKKFNAVPVMMDIGGVFGIRPDGVVVSTLWDDPNQVQIETEARIINIIYFAASKKFPSLASLAPQRTEKSKTCPHCNGSGSHPGFGGAVVCYCGGMGWLPE
jgi:hypothetical protein